MKKVIALMTAGVLVAGLVTVATARGRWGGGPGYGPGLCRENLDRDDDRFEGRFEGRPGFRQGDGALCPNCPNNPDAGEGDRGAAFRGPRGPLENGEEASAIVTGWIERTGNPNLKVGKVADSGRDYEVEIVTKDGSLANKVFVEKRTGRMIPAYR